MNGGQPFSDGNYSRTFVLILSDSRSFSLVNPGELMDACFTLVAWVWARFSSHSVGRDCFRRFDLLSVVAGNLYLFVWEVD